MGALTDKELGGLLLRLSEESGIRNLIETGTYMGESTEWASNYFDKVYTIEAAEIIYHKAVEKFADKANIECLHGESQVVLETILKGAPSSYIFWLDAHWSGGITAGESNECPLLEEIRIIRNKTLNYIIFIDDARLFLNPPPPPHKAEQWPSLDKIKKAAAGDNIYVFRDAIILVSDKKLNSIIETIAGRPL